MERQSNKPIDYFTPYIEKQSRRIVKFENVFNEKEIEPDHARSLRLSIFLAALNIVIAKFSLGAPPKEMLPLFTTTLQKLTASDFEFGYWDALALLSIGILLEISDEEFEQLVKAVDDRAFLSDDRLFSYLIAYRIPDRAISKKIQFHRPYSTLIHLFETGEFDAEEEIKRYLEKEWYRSHTDCGWHDSHKSPHNTYFGYWSFEAAAVVKIRKVDDSSFKDNQYYPYDLVHWKD